MQLFQRFIAECRDAEGHVLQVLSTLLRRDDHFGETAAVDGLLILRVRCRQAGEYRRAERERLVPHQLASSAASHGRYP
jgi:hypothetical protein